MAAQLWLDEPTSQKLILEEGSAFDVNTLPETVKYVIRVGNIPLAGDGIVVASSSTKIAGTDLASWYLIKNSTAEKIASGEDK
jgi:hypothetical protein